MLKIIFSKKSLENLKKLKILLVVIILFIVKEY